MNNSLYTLLQNDKDLDINQMINSQNIVMNNLNMISAARNSTSLAQNYENME